MTAPTTTIAVAPIPNATALRRAVTIAGGAVISATVIGAAAAAIDPALGPATHPHPTLTPAICTALALWQTNARVLAAPFLLAALRFAGSRTGRTIGDLIIVALAGYSTLSVGLALGRWGLVLIPYVPNLPCEWAALALSVAVWLLVRGHTAGRGQLLALGGAIVVLLAGAAVLETWATPHRVTAGHRTAVVTSRRLASSREVEGPMALPLIFPAQSAGGSLSHHQTPTPSKEGSPA